MRFLITAGPTREAIDPVRYLTNRSSGKMGYALAQAARDAGHEVILISGPVNLAPPTGVELIIIESAHQLWEATRNTLSLHSVDVAILAAAVADYRPKVTQNQKIKKSADTLTLELERTPDILGSMRNPFGFTGTLVGFAAETENLEAHAMDKLRRKHCDMTVANDVSQQGRGFDSDNNEALLCFPDGHTELLPDQSKLSMATAIIRRCEILTNAP